MTTVEKIQRLAKARGITQDAVEVAAGLPKGRISKWKDGKGEPSASQALRIARILDVPVELLIDEAVEDVATGSGDEIRYLLRIVQDIGGFEVAKKRLLKVPDVEVSGTYDEIRKERQSRGGKDGGRRSGT